MKISLDSITVPQELSLLGFFGKDSLSRRFWGKLYLSLSMVTGRVRREEGGHLTIHPHALGHLGTAPSPACQGH